VSAGAAGLTRVHVPRLLGALQTNCGWSQAVSQHTPSTQKVDAHSPGVTHAPPFGTGVIVGVAELVAVCVAVAVPVAVDVVVPVAVAVAVSVAVDVVVPVAVAVGVWVGVDDGVGLLQAPKRPPLQEPPATNIEPGNTVHVFWSVSTHVA